MKLFGPFDKEDFELFGMSAVALVLTAVALSNPLSVGARSDTFAVSATSQAAAVALTTSGTVSTSPNPVIACPALTRLLARGSRGADVSELQAHLISEGYLSADSQTGYFGPLTEGALKRWQAQNGIVSSGDAASTGYGLAGPRTRAALLKCREGSHPPASSSDEKFSVSPQSGTAPLTVTASFMLGSSCSAYTLTWGDGENSSYAPPSDVSCAQVVVRAQKTHTYTEDGTYKVSFKTGDSARKSETVKVSSATDQNPIVCTQDAKQCSDGSWVGRTGPNCTFTCPEENNPIIVCTQEAKICPDGSAVGRTGPSCEFAPCPTAASVSFSASPQSGAAPLGVVFTVNNTSAGNYYVDFGDGLDAKMEPNCTTGISGSYNCNIGSYFASHYYQNAGTYTAAALYAPACASGASCAQVLQQIGAVTITVTSS